MRDRVRGLRPPAGCVTEFRIQNSEDREGKKIVVSSNQQPVTSKPPSLLRELRSFGGQASNQ
jgi:hypothetical protein